MTIEAVNSVLSNAPYMKAVVEQQSTAKSLAANPTRVQEVSQQAPYVSLYIKVDLDFDRAILQLRDGQTGDVVQQIPSESQMEAYRRAQEVIAPKQQTASEMAQAYIPEGSASAKQAASTVSVPAQVAVSTPVPQQKAAPQIQQAVVAPSTPAPQQAPVSVNTEA